MTAPAARRRVATGRYLAVVVAIWQIYTGVVVLNGGHRRSSSARWEDVTYILQALDVPAHHWGFLPLVGGVLVLVGVGLTLTKLSDAGLCSALQFAGHLCGFSSAWVMGSSAYLAAMDNDTASFAPAVQGLILGLGVTGWCVWRAGGSVREAARTGRTGCRK